MIVQDLRDVVDAFVGEPQLLQAFTQFLFFHGALWCAQEYLHYLQYRREQLIEVLRNFRASLRQFGECEVQHFRRAVSAFDIMHRHCNINQRFKTTAYEV